MAEDPIAQLRRQRREGVGGLTGQGFQDQAAYDNFVEIFGREPTVDEWRLAAANFGGEGGFDKGRTYLSALFQQQQAAKQEPQAEAKLAEDEGARQQAQIQQEAARQQQAIADLTGQQFTLGESEVAGESRKRAEMRAQLAELLNKEQERQFSENLPYALEDLNSRKLLNSSALGTELARQRRSMAEQTSNVLGAQALGDTEEDIAARRNIIAQRMAGEQAATERGLGLNTSALEKRLGFQEAGLQRQYDRADWERQVALARELGGQVKPEISANKRIATGALGGAVSGGTIGATAGGPWGAAIGAILGAGGGGAVGGK